MQALDLIFDASLLLYPMYSVSLTIVYPVYSLGHKVPHEIPGESITCGKAPLQLSFFTAKVDELAMTSLLLPPPGLLDTHVTRLIVDGGNHAIEWDSIEHVKRYTNAFVINEQSSEVQSSSTFTRSDGPC
jgi:hypothetical protein